MPALFFSASTALRSSYVGNWSPYTLLLVFLMIFIGLILLVVLIIYALMGRFLPHQTFYRGAETPPAEDEPFSDEERTPTRSEQATMRKAKQAAQTLPDSAKPPVRKTGWQYLLGGMGCSILSVAVFSWVDSPYGQMRTFTFGAAVNLLLFAAQLYLIARFALCQRRMGR